MTEEKNNNKKTKIFKRLLILFIVILLIFGTINAVWFFGYRIRYIRLSKNMTQSNIEGLESGGEERYYLEVGDYSIVMKTPAYLGEGGFIAIDRTEGYVVQYDENGELVSGDDLLVTLYVWPQYFSGYTVGLMFYDKYNEITEMAEVDSNLEIVDVDVYDPEDLELIEELMEENMDEINVLINIAEENLGIDIVN